MVVEAVVFDLDGVLIDSEQIWNQVRESFVKERGGRWHSHAHRDMMGMSAPEWSRYMHDILGLSDSPLDISAEVVRRMEGMYRHELPLMKGAVQAVNRLAGPWRLAIALIFEPTAHRHSSGNGRARTSVCRHHCFRGSPAGKARSRCLSGSRIGVSQIVLRFACTILCKAHLPVGSSRRSLEHQTDEQCRHTMVLSFV